MTKKDYELFANEINRIVPSAQKELLFDLTARVFARDNAAFQPEKYKRACFEGKHIRKSISGKV